MAWAPDYASVSDLKKFLRIPLDDTQDDFAIQLAISAASRAVDRSCNRQFGRDDAPTTRFYTAHYDRAARCWIVPIDDLMETTGVFEVGFDANGTGVYAPTTVGLAWTFYPVNARAAGMPYTSLRVASGLSARESAVSVRTTFGWTTIPPIGVKQAVMLQASRFVARRDSPYGIAGSPDTGSEMRLLARLDPDVEVSLSPYRRAWAVAA